VYFAPGFTRIYSELLFFHEDTLGGVTTLVRQPSGMRVLLTNGKFQANDGGEVKAQEGFALIPVLMVPRRGDALVIGLGSGYSARVVAQAGFARVDVAELSPGVVLAARTLLADLNDHVLDRPGVRLYLEDGRNHLLLSDRAYDLVSMEISSVWFAGATSSYSREFYELVRRHLAPGGVLQQWVQIHHLTMDEIGSTLATVRAVFPHAELWLRGGQGVIVASEGPLQIGGEGLAAFYERERDAGAPADDDLLDLLGQRALSSAGLDALLAGRQLKINTDHNRYLEYTTPRYATDDRPLREENVRALRAMVPPAPPDLAADVPAHVRDLLRRTPWPPPDRR
jgi:spermidine synthase